MPLPNFKVEVLGLRTVMFQHVDYLPELHFNLYNQYQTHKFQQKIEVKALVKSMKQSTLKNIRVD